VCVSCCVVLCVCCLLLCSSFFSVRLFVAEREHTHTPQTTPHSTHYTPSVRQSGSQAVRQSRPQTHWIAQTSLYIINHNQSFVESLFVGLFVVWLQIYVCVCVGWLQYYSVSPSVSQLVAVSIGWLQCWLVAVLVGCSVGGSRYYSSVALFVGRSVGRWSC